MLSLSEGIDRKPKTHIKAMTYPDKIKAVIDGDCRQTIRQKHNIIPGDKILFHGWTDKPYRSPWSWRKEIIVQTMDYILVFPEGIAFMRRDSWIIPWDSSACYLLAAEDYINPPTGPALRDTLIKLNGPFSPAGTEYQIIRW